jgi:hypothetical protein
VTAFFSFFPKLFAKTAVTAAVAPQADARSSQPLPFELRAEIRAVARRSDTL